MWIVEIVQWNDEWPGDEDCRRQFAHPVEHSNRINYAKEYA